MMENTTDIKIPEGFTPPPVEDTTVKPKFNPINNLKGGKKLKENEIMDERPRLPRTNRTVKCIFCDEEKILNPDQYQSYYDYWGDEDKIVKNFSCKPCEMKQKENPIKFWYLNSNESKRLVRNIKTAFDLYRASEKRKEDILVLQRMCDHFLAVESFCDRRVFEFVAENQLPEAIKIKNIPLVGDIILKPYDEKRKIQSV